MSFSFAVLNRRVRCWKIQWNFNGNSSGQSLKFKVTRFSYFRWMFRSWGQVIQLTFDVSKILKNCFSIRNWSYFLRICASWRLPNFISSSDNQIRQISSINNLTKNDGLKQTYQCILEESELNVLKTFIFQHFSLRLSVEELSSLTYSIHQATIFLSAWQALNVTIFPTNPECIEIGSLWELKDFIDKEYIFNFSFSSSLYNLDSIIRKKMFMCLNGQLNIGLVTHLH